MKILVRYYDVENNESQYKDLDLAAMKSREICLARYIKAKGPYAGNPYIEALPLPRSAEDIASDYNNSIKPASVEEIKAMSLLDKELMIDTLDQVRFRLPFHNALEMTFYSSLVRSYAARKTVYSRLDSLTIVIDNKKEESHSILFGDSAQATDGSFCLCGASGSGKTAALNVLLSHYPQVIRHPDYDNTIQIVYLAVNCIPNSNLSVLCDAIGDAVDKALGNIEPFYYEIVRKCRTLGIKMDKIRQFIEQFKIGVIILDEIQLLSFESNKEASFESFMVLVNRTKVAVIVVGTPDARDKMFRSMRTARRIGNTISADSYCERYKYAGNKLVPKKVDFFGYLVKNIMMYQCFDEPVEVTGDIIDAFYDCSLGMVGILVNVYKCVCRAYCNSKKNKRPVINGDYIRAVAFNNFDNLPVLLEKVKNEREYFFKSSVDKKNLWLSICHDERQALLQEEENIVNNSAVETKLNRLLDELILMFNSEEIPEREIRTEFNRFTKKNGALNVLNMKRTELSKEFKAVIKKMVAKRNKGMANTNSLPLFCKEGFKVG